MVAFKQATRYLERRKVWQWEVKWIEYVWILSRKRKKKNLKTDVVRLVAANFIAMRKVFFGGRCIILSRNVKNAKRNFAPFFLTPC